MARPTQPPELSFFAKRREPFGDMAVGLRLGSLEIELAGLDGKLVELLFERYKPYSVRERTTANPMRLRVADEQRDYFIDPPQTTETVRVYLACQGEHVRYLSYRVAACLDTGQGTGDLLLSRGGWEPVERALENIIRAAVAWRAACSGGALIHAASAVLEGRGYLFYGESGAGKSTLSECNRRARIVSDDLSLLLPNAAGQLELVGTPFRGTYEEGAPVSGSFPLAAGFRLIQSSKAEVRPVEPLRALSELVGNLPFVAEAFAGRPDLFATIERAFSSIPLAHLHFSKDDSYWDAILAAGY